MLNHHLIVSEMALIQLFFYKSLERMKFYYITLLRWKFHEIQRKVYGSE